MQALRRLPSHLKMSHLEVTNEYREGFIRAMNTVKYQLIFDPLTRSLRPLTSYPSGCDHKDFPYCGEFFGDEKGMQIALGNVNVQTGQVIGSFDPDYRQQVRIYNYMHATLVNDSTCHLLLDQSLKIDS